MRITLEVTVINQNMGRLWDKTIYTRHFVQLAKNMEKYSSFKFVY
jgi:hypothetical protein